MGALGRMCADLGHRRRALQAAGCAGAAAAYVQGSSSGWASGQWEKRGRVLRAPRHMKGCTGAMDVRGWEHQKPKALGMPWEASMRAVGIVPEGAAANGRHDKAPRPLGGGVQQSRSALATCKVSVLVRNLGDVHGSVGAGVNGCGMTQAQAYSHVGSTYVGASRAQFCQAAEQWEKSSLPGRCQQVLSGPSTSGACRLPVRP